MINKQQLVVTIPKSKQEEMDEALIGYWENDIWDMKEEIFNDFWVKNTNNNHKRYIDFSSLKHSLKQELKYYFFVKLTTHQKSLWTVIHNAIDLLKLKDFTDTHYPNINSFIEVPNDKGLKKWSSFIVNKYKKEAKFSNRFFKDLLNFYVDFYDERNEFEKDVWDFRKIPGAKFTSNKAHYSINFKKVPPVFKEVVKLYCKYKVNLNMSLNEVFSKLSAITHFLIFISTNKSEWIDLNNLTRKEIEIYLGVLKKDKGHTKGAVGNYLLHIRDFLEYLEKNEHEMAPKKPIRTIMFKEDVPKRGYQKYKIKHIPDEIIPQLEKVLNTDPDELTPTMLDSDKKLIPIVILLLRTGWRINDISNLRYSNCLVFNKGWYLQGDINKTDVKLHRVPIDDEVAKMVQSVVETTKQVSTDENNPENYLFPTLKGNRKGLPINSKLVSNTLNKWAVNYKIKDNNGNTYHFNNHAFRHTKGVELVNAGMNLVHIQKWMAHASPEMTLVYAKITDDTLRREWLVAKEKSDFLKIDINQGTVKEATDEDLIEWEYIRHNIEAAKVPMGYCMASQKMGCPYVETPCLTCTNFCTTPDNLSEFDSEIKNLKDLIQRTKDMPIWNEKNQKRFEKLNEIRETLAMGKIHHPAGKKAREYPKGTELNVK